MGHVGELAALGTAVCWAVGSNLFAAAGRSMGSQVLNRLRIVVACGFLGAALWVTRGTPWPVWATPTQMGLLAVSGLVGFVFGDGWYFRALIILGPGKASLLASTAPIFTALIAWPVLGEHPGPLAWLGMLLTMSGVALAIGSRASHGANAAASPPAHREGSLAIGVMAGLLGALGQSGGYVLSKIALRSGIDPLSATVVRVTAAAIAIGMLTAAQRAVPQTVGALHDRRAAAFMVGGAFLGPFLGVTLSLTAIQHIDTGIAASITAVYPIFALLIAARFHGEQVTAKAVLGAVIAVVGVIVLFQR